MPENRQEEQTNKLEGPLAQRSEQQTHNLSVAGSNPARPTITLQIQNFESRQRAATAGDWDAAYISTSIADSKYIENLIMYLEYLRKGLLDRKLAKEVEEFRASAKSCPPSNMRKTKKGEGSLSLEDLLSEII